MLPEEEVKKVFDKCEALLKHPLLDDADARYIATIMDTLGWVLGHPGNLLVDFPEAP